MATNYENRILSYANDPVNLLKTYKWYAINSGKVADDNGAFFKLAGILPNTIPEVDLKNSSFAQRKDYYKAVGNFQNQLFNNPTLLQQALKNLGLNTPEGVGNFAKAYSDFHSGLPSAFGQAGDSTQWNPQSQTLEALPAQATPSLPSTPSMTLDQASASQQGLTRDQLADRANQLVPTQLPTTPVSLSPSTQIDSTQLTATPRTAFDVQSLLARNNALVQQKIASLQPSQDERAAQAAYANAKSRVLALQAQAAGQYNPNNESIPLPALVGEAQSQMFSAQLAEENALSKLTLFQKDRELLNQALQDQIQSGQFNLQIAMQLDQSQKEEQKAAKQFALENDVRQPFYNVGGTIYRTADGKAYSNPEQFFADGGAKDWSNVQKVEVGTDLKQYPVSYQEYLLAKQEGFNGTYNDYQTMDANRHRSINNTIIQGDQNAAKQEARVKQIIAAHPGEWGNAADQIDKEFGAGTATKYDDLLKAAYSPNALKRQTASTVDPQTLTDLNSDIDAGSFSLSELYDAYPELSPELIQSIYYNR